MNDEIAKINTVVDEIEEVLDKNRVPTPNTYAVNRIRFLINTLPNGYIREKARKILSNAEDFYSLRKHEKHLGGASGLYSNMGSLLRRIKSHAKYLQEEAESA